MNKKPSITVRQEVRLSIYGRDFKRARYTSGFSLWKVSQFMQLKGWTYYPMKLHRLESQEIMTLNTGEMISLLQCVNTDFRIT